jgi:hypothetical protein
MYRGEKLVEVKTAKCSPEDRFDFKVGAKIAFDRLVGEKKEEPKYKIGDKVIVDSTNVDHIDNQYRGAVGEIVKIDTTYQYPYCVRIHKDDTVHELWSKVSGYAPTYYNGKVVCVDTTDTTCGYILGKIYEIKDGFLYKDGCGVYPTTPVSTFAEFKSRSSAKWLEVVE